MAKCAKPKKPRKAKVSVPGPPAVVSTRASRTLGRKVQRKDIRIHHRRHPNYAKCR